MEIKDIIVVFHQRKGTTHFQLISAADALTSFPEYAFMLGSGSVIRLGPAEHGSDDFETKGCFMNFGGYLFNFVKPKVCPVFAFSKQIGYWIAKSGVVVN